jgi:hypothetical protein
VRTRVSTESVVLTGGGAGAGAGSGGGAGGGASGGRVAAAPRRTTGGVTEMKLVGHDGRSTFVFDPDGEVSRRLEACGDKPFKIVAITGAYRCCATVPTWIDSGCRLSRVACGLVALSLRGANGGVMVAGRASRFWRACCWEPITERCSNWDTTCDRARRASTAR